MTEAMQATWNEFVDSIEGEWAWNKYVTMGEDLRSFCWCFHTWMQAQTGGELAALNARIAELEALSASQEQAHALRDAGGKL